MKISLVCKFWHQVLVMVLITCLTHSAWAQDAFDDDEEDPAHKGLVEVEGQDFVRVKGTSQLIMRDYTKRAKSWGLMVGLGVSMYKPQMVANDETTDGEEATYDSPGPITNLIEAQLSPKFNTRIGSMSVDFGIGQYYDHAHGLENDTYLLLNLYRVGATLYFDHVFHEPYVVPYASGGIYQVNYTEEGGNGTSNNVDNKGTSPVSSYVAAGLNLQLNWLDKRTAMVAYQEIGMLNGFLFAEGRMLTAAGDGPDFSSHSVDVNAGMRIEF